MPQNAFFPQIRDLLDSQKLTQRQFFPPSIPFPQQFLQLQQWWHLYCFAILGLTSIVIHSVKQRLLRNRPGSDAATSRDFLRERLQRAFTCANQLHWTVKQTNEWPTDQWETYRPSSGELQKHTKTLIWHENWGWACNEWPTAPQDTDCFDTVLFSALKQTRYISHVCWSVCAVFLFMRGYF